MTKPQSRRASMTFDGVERDLTSGAPSAFRIWRAGDNTTAHGPTFFTEQSAALLLEQQQTKGTKYSIDVNHLSLDASAPLENQRAVGWFSIDVRDGELWAVECEWVDWVKQGLIANPPEWKYHSPAYDVDVDTGEVMSLTNLAITNTPATFYVTALASANSDTSRKKASMTKDDLLAAFASADEETQNAIHSAIGAAAVAKASKKSKASEDGEDEDKGLDKESEKASDDEADKKASDEEPDTKATLASVVAKQDKELSDLKKMVASLVKKSETDERTTLLAQHEMTKELRASLATLDLASVKKVCASLPKADVLKSKSTETIQATALGGSGELDRSNPANMNSEHADRIRAKFGLAKTEAKVASVGTKRVFEAMTASEAKAFAARKAGK